MYILKDWLYYIIILYVFIKLVYFIHDKNRIKLQKKKFISFSFKKIYETGSEFDERTNTLINCLPILNKMMEK